MKKRIISVIVMITLVVTILPITASAVDGLTYFSRTRTYQSGQFTDFSSSDWFAVYVQAAYEYDLVDGKTDTAFDPDATLTIAEAVKLAVQLRSIYYTGEASFSNGDPWYAHYVDYARDNGIIDGDYKNYDAAVTRSEFALMLSRAFPPEALAPRNTVEDNAIPDVLGSASYSDAVYLLYRAGILTGSDAAGTFFPNDTLRRNEAAAIVVRMVNAAFRRNLTLKISLTTQEINAKCSPAVFYIEIYDIKNKPIKTGSGFFIDDSGVAVTNYHVVRGAARAVITTYDGSEYEVSGIYDYDAISDIALLQINGSGFATLEMGDSDAVVTGQKAYAIGSPLGFTNTLSDGIVSSASRMLDGVSYIQTTAPISPGSSGGALLDGTGKVIGITTMTAVDAQNLNIAVPINFVQLLDDSSAVPLRSILPDTVYYTNYFPVPDFGAFSGAPVYTSGTEFDSPYYFYKTSSFSTDAEDVLNDYALLLMDNNFILYGYAVEMGSVVTYYFNEAYDLLVSYAILNVDDNECVRIMIY